MKQAKWLSGLVLTLSCLAACEGPCADDAECPEEQPYCVEGACVECRSTADCRMGSLRLGRNGNPGSYRPGETCEQHECKSCRCVGAGPGAPSALALLGLLGLPWLRRRSAGVLAVLAMSATGCGEPSMGERLQEGLDLFASRACGCGGEEPSRCSGEGRVVACVDDAYEAGTPASKLAIECVVASYERAVECFEAVPVCDLDALSACARRAFTSCPPPSEATIQRLRREDCAGLL